MGRSTASNDPSIAQYNRRWIGVTAYFAGDAESCTRLRLAGRIDLRLSGADGHPVWIQTDPVS